MNNKPKNYIDDTTVWRYQAVEQTVFSEKEYCVYQVAVDVANLRNIKYLIDPTPVNLVGEDINEVMEIIKQAHRDIRVFGIIKEQDLHEQEAFIPGIIPLLDAAFDDFSSRSSNSISYEDEDMLESSSDEDDYRDKEDRVVDIVDFMKGRGR